jgi:nitrogen regulatory protein P-II 1
MNKSEIKAFIHRNRVADVVNALNNEGFRNITVVDVECILKTLSSADQNYSVEIGQKVVKEVKLELVCDNDERTAVAVDAIRQHAKTGQPSAGWIYITKISSSIEITD